MMMAFFKKEWFDRRTITVITVCAVSLAMLFSFALLYKPFMRHHYVARFEAGLRMPEPENWPVVIKYGILLDKTRALIGMRMGNVRQLFGKKPWRTAFVKELEETVWQYDLPANYTATVGFKQGKVSSFSMDGEEGSREHESQLPAPYSLRSW